MEASCSTCRFYRSHVQGQGLAYGACHRRSPATGHQHDYATWPIVQATYWCGEHEPPAAAPPSAEGLA